MVPNDAEIDGLIDLWCVTFLHTVSDSRRIGAERMPVEEKEPTKTLGKVRTFEKERDTLN